jgi:hypothetical protein
MHSKRCGTSSRLELLAVACTVYGATNLCGVVKRAALRKRGHAAFSKLQVRGRSLSSLLGLSNCRLPSPRSCSCLLREWISFVQYCNGEEHAFQVQCRHHPKQAFPCVYPFTSPIRAMPLQIIFMECKMISRSTSPSIVMAIAGACRGENRKESAQAAKP